MLPTETLLACKASITKVSIAIQIIDLLTTLLTVLTNYYVSCHMVNKRLYNLFGILFHCHRCSIIEILILI